MEKREGRNQREEKEDRGVKFKEKVKDPGM